MTLDIHTLFFISIISRLSFLTVFATIVASQPNERHLWHWLVALVSITSGLTLLWSPGNFLELLRSSIGHGLVLLSIVFSWSGLRLFYGRRVHLPTIIGVPVFLTFLYIALTTSGVAERFALPILFVAATVVCAIIVAEVLNTPEPRYVTQYVIALAYLGYCLSFLLPAVLLPTGILSARDLFGSQFTVVFDQIGGVMVYFAYTALTGERANLQLKVLSETDPLTGLGNRRSADHAFTRLHRECLAGNLSCVLLGDIDHFKAINDRYGHEAGDAILRLFSKRLSHFIRRGDIAVRWGGEELLILLPDTDLAEAEQIAQRLRRLIADYPFIIGEQRLDITLSIGVAQSHCRDTSFEATIQRADRALYRSKSEGRNRVCCQPS
ncbi:GGDEF domain-containing protein [Kushneria aurantia]|uniref:diguanylate cyclase n=1 Tax=Kushneria aurantia TaxID=504092 RepID=A0ABV6G2R1_9GAMM|nr:GGDEF domain-containing protein [Kushneria aurantia]